MCLNLEKSVRMNLNKFKWMNMGKGYYWVTLKDFFLQ